jgi:uncharacterized phage protein gp47/JayE
MAFSRPSLAELVERIQKDFESRLSLQAPLLRRALVYVFARVVAGAVHMLHGHIEWGVRQVFPDQAERERLLQFGGLFGLSLNPAAYASGNLVLAGTNATVVPLRTIFQRADGTTYTSGSDATIATLTAWAGATAYVAGDLRRNGGNVYQCITAGTSAGSGGPTTTSTDITDGTVHWRYIAVGSAAALAAVTADVAGLDGSCDLGTAITFQSPVAGASSAATVAYGGLSGGADEEDIEDFRVRVLARLRSPPHGGNADDYVAWAKEVSGVTRAWCYPLEGGAGTVTVRFVRDDDASIIPDSGEVTAVQNHIDGKAPVTAVVTVAAPTADALNYTLHIVPDTTATRAAVEAELKDLVRRESAPGGAILLSHIRSAIGSATGVTDYTLTSPAADVVHATGHMAVHGTVTWT